MPSVDDARLGMTAPGVTPGPIQLRQRKPTPRYATLRRHGPRSLGRAGLTCRLSVSPCPASGRAACSACVAPWRTSGSTAARPGLSGSRAQEHPRGPGSPSPLSLHPRGRTSSIGAACCSRRVGEQHARLARESFHSFLADPRPAACRCSATRWSGFGVHVMRRRGGRGWPDSNG